MYFSKACSDWTAEPSHVIITSLDQRSKKSSINNRKLSAINQQESSKQPTNQEHDVTFQKVQYVSIDSDHEGRRIDNFLSNFLKTVPKGRIYKMLRKGEVRVNKKRISANYRLIVDDNVRIPPVFIENREEPVVPKSLIEQLTSAIIYEDDDFLILNKPAGIPVHAGSGLSYGVIEGFRAMPRFTDAYIELAHRLDRDTSGCLILVKQARLLREMNKIIKENQMEKRYLALLKGRWNNFSTGIKAGKSLMVEAPLRKNTLRGGERMVQVHKEGKTARTEFIFRKQFADATLVEVKLHTGRTHQIRVHAAHIGMPIAGDTKYGNEKFNKQMKNNRCRRLFLHASHVSFQPENMDNIKVDSPLPEPLTLILDAI